MTASDVEKTRLLLIDGHAMAFRAFFALPADGFSDGRGQATNAVYGFTRMIFTVVAAERPTHVAVAFDLPGGTFRDRIYDQYKGGREETPPAFHGQIDLITTVLDALGVAWFTVEDYEADDIIATLATRAAAAQQEALIVSSDRDAIQLISDHVTLLQPVKGVSEMRRMDAPAIQEKYGVTPEQYPELAALVGESADNLPGVPGVGPKTAAKWIATYGDLDGVLAHADEIKGKAGQSLRDHREAVVRNRRMNAAVIDLDLPTDPSRYAIGGGDRDAMTAAFDDLAFGPTIRRDAPAILFADTGESEQHTALTAAEIHAVDDADQLHDALGDAEHPLAVDVTEDVRGGAMLALAVPDDAAFVQLSAMPDTLREALRSVLDTAPSILVADAPAVRLLLEEHGIDLPPHARDLSLDAFVLRPGARSYETEALAAEHAGVSFPPRPRKPAQRTLAKESEEERNGHIETAGKRLAQAAGALHTVATRLDEGLADEPWALQLLDQLERPLQRNLETLHRRGIAVDPERLARLEAEFEGFVAQARSEAGAIVGEDVNLSSPKQLQTLLFDRLGMPHTKRIASGYSTDAESLQDLQEKSSPDSPGFEFLSWLLRFREMNKLLGYLVGLREAVRGSRIHTTFLQTAAATGRLASTNPNLQNIPVRTDEGRRLREVFVPGGDFASLMTADYSQIEMRIMAHLSEDDGLITAFNSGEDLHRFVASRVFDVAPEDVDGAMRSKTKAVSYGLAYGLSAYGLSRQLRISQAEATQLRNGYFERFGGVRDYLRSSVETARELGYTQTILGRRRYLPDLTSDNRQRRENAERVALNSPIQGSAADIIKLAMMRVEQGIADAGLRSRVLLQVHDELVLDVAEGEEDVLRQVVTDGMSGAYELSVPLEVGVGIGPDWLAAAH